MKFSTRLVLTLCAVAALICSCIVVPRLQESWAIEEFGGEGGLHAGFTRRNPTSLEHLFGMRGAVQTVSLNSAARDLPRLLELLEKFRSARSVDFSWINDECTVAELGELNGVRKVSFFRCSAGFVRWFLRRVPNVEVIEINKCDVSDSVFSDLTSDYRLIDLEVRITQIEGTIFHAPAFARLQNLTIDFSPLTQDAIEAIASMDGLQSLYIGCESTASKLDFSHLQFCSSLKRVEFAGCDLDASSLVDLRKALGNGEVFVGGVD